MNFHSIKLSGDWWLVTVECLLKHNVQFVTHMQQQNIHCQEEEKLFDQICRREGWSDECFLDVSSQILPLSSPETPTDLAFTFCDLPLTSQDHTRLWKDLELYVGTGWLGIDIPDQPYS